MARDDVVHIALGYPLSSPRSKRRRRTTNSDATDRPGDRPRQRQMSPPYAPIPPQLRAEPDWSALGPFSELAELFPESPNMMAHSESDVSHALPDTARPASVELDSNRQLGQSILDFLERTEFSEGFV